MPETSFKFEVSAVKSTAVIFATPFLKRAISKLLRQKGLSVKTSGDNTVDYIIDCIGSQEAIHLAKNPNTKYLRLIVGSQIIPPFEKINWRVVRTDFLVGPQMPNNSTLGQLLTNAIKNQIISLPGTAKTEIYPLYISDLAVAIWQALVLPGTAQKEFLVLGQPVELERLGSFLQDLGQTTKGVHFASGNEIPLYPLNQIQVAYKELNWLPKVNWQEGLEKSFRQFWKEIDPEKGEEENKEEEKEEAPFTIPKTVVQQPVQKEKPTPTSQPEIIKPQPIVEKELTPDKEETIVIEEEPADESETEEVKVDKYKPEQIEEFVIKREEEEKEKIEEKQEKEEKSKEKKKIRIPFGKMVFTLTLFALLAILGTWIKPIASITLASLNLKKGLEEVKLQSWDRAKDYIEQAEKNFSQGEDFLKNHRLRVLLFGADQKLGQVAEMGKKIAIAGKHSIPLAKNSLSLSEAILKDKEFDFKTGLAEIENQYLQLNSDLSIIEALLGGNWRWLPPRWKNLPNEWKQKLKDTRQMMEEGEQIIGHLPWLIGLDNQKRVFLVLLQNNMELRPTGGFIGSFALLTLEDGHLIDFEVKDVYEADGQLKGHVEPPLQIKEILGEANWYLRDANWNPSFPKTATNAEWFLEKELGREVDGVIGLNLEAGKKLVDAFGEVSLPDFNERINADNLFERAEFWSESEFFPGSTQKSAFLGLLGKQLFENIKAARVEEYFKIAQAILESLREKEILVYASNKPLTSTLYQNNWDGTVREPKCNLGNCFTDYLFLVEANLGVNKANYFIKRSAEENIDFTESGKIDHKLKINYENTATSENWPGGKYVNWLRIYLPLETKIEEIVIYDPLNSNERKTVKPEDREEEIKDGKEVIGFKVNVPIKERRTVEVRFSQLAQNNQETFGYLLYWQKQSGYRETPVSVLISFPGSWQPIQVNPAANLVSGKLLFNQTLSTDLNFGVEFEK